MNNPERRNAISLDMWQGIAEAFKSSLVIQKFAALLCLGQNKAFASGADISQFKNEGRMLTPPLNMQDINGW